MALSRPSAPEEFSHLFADDEAMQRVIAESKALAAQAASENASYEAILKESEKLEQERQANAQLIKKIEAESLAAERARSIDAAIAKDQAFRLKRLESSVIETTAECCELIAKLKKLEPHLAIHDFLQKINEASKYLDIESLEAQRVRLERTIAEYQHLHAARKALDLEQQSMPKKINPHSLWNRQENAAEQRGTIYNMRVFNGCLK